MLAIIIRITTVRIVMIIIMMSLQSRLGSVQHASKV